MRLKHRNYENNLSNFFRYKFEQNKSLDEMQNPIQKFFYRAAMPKYSSSHIGLIEMVEANRPFQFEEVDLVYQLEGFYYMGKSPEGYDIYEDEFNDLMYVDTKRMMLLNKNKRQVGFYE